MLCRKLGCCRERVCVWKVEEKARWLIFMSFVSFLRQRVCTWVVDVCARTKSASFDRRKKERRRGDTVTLCLLIKDECLPTASFLTARMLLARACTVIMLAYLSCNMIISLAKCWENVTFHWPSRLTLQINPDTHRLKHFSSCFQLYTTFVIHIPTFFYETKYFLQ